MRKMTMNFHKLVYHLPVSYFDCDFAKVFISPKFFLLFLRRLIMKLQIQFSVFFFIFICFSTYLLWFFIPSKCLTKLLDQWFFDIWTSNFKNKGQCFRSNITNRWFLIENIFQEYFLYFYKFLLDRSFSLAEHL
jgi:hypothetical protein